MGLRRNFSAWDLFSRIFGINWFYGGEILLAYGDYSIEIKTKQKIKRVWVSTSISEDATPVCCGNISIVGSRVHNGFVEISAEVRTESVSLNYWLEF